jgi:hypothetical protein
MTLFTTAYAGSAQLDEENVAALLDQLLPDNLGMVYVPERVTRSQPGLRLAVKWLEAEVGTEGTIPVPNLLDALLKRREETGDEVALVMAYDPDKDAELAKEAHDKGIRVINLAAAGDDLLFEEEAPADEEPPFDTDEATPATEEATAEPAAPSPAEVIAKASAAGLAAAEAARANGRQGVVIQLTVPPEALAMLAQALVAAMGAQAAETMKAAQPEPVASVTPITEAASSKGPKDPQPPGTIVHYYNKDEARYRPARGRLRPGEERVFLTPEEVKEAKAKNMLA